MGLDVYARRVGALIRPKPEGQDDDSYWAEGDQPGRVIVCVNDAFPTRADGLVDGLYEGEDLGAHVGASYGGHNRFREALAMAAHGVMPEVIWREIDEGKRPDSGPFVALIHFADNEGTLGPETCRKLLADFDNHAAEMLPKMGEWARHYDRWREMLRTTVAAGGILDFS
jgi:hypothetical protein